MTEDIKVVAPPKEGEGEGGVVAETGKEQTNWEELAKGYQGALKDLGYDDVKPLTERYRQYEGAVTQSYNFFQKHPEIYDLYRKFSAGEDVKFPGFKESEKSKDGEKPAIDEEKFLEKVRNEVNSMREPELEVVRQLKASQEKQQAQAKHKWLDDANYKELDNRFSKLTEDEVKARVYKGMNRAEAVEAVREKYSDFSIDQLINLLMVDKVVENLSQAKRTPEPLPESMTRISNKTAATPTAIQQAQKEYMEATKMLGSDEDATLNVVKKWAVEFGMPLKDAHKLLNGE